MHYVFPLRIHFVFPFCLSRNRACNISKLLSPPPRVPSLSREDIFFFPIELPSFLPFVRFRFLIRRKKEGKEKKKETKRKRKKRNTRDTTLGSKKLIGYAIFDRQPGFGRGRGGKGPPLLTRVVNGVASACVTIGN